MKKVGILSMQRVANYGSFWQAYCLKNMIAEAGDCEVEFIDIVPGEVETRAEYKKSFSFKKMLRIPYYLFQRRKAALFDTYQRSVLDCSEKPNYRSDYDTVVIGSDEVFNCAQESPWGFSTQLFGNIDNNNVNSYAACFGYTTLSSIQKRNIGNIIAKGINNIRNLSVRDNNSSDIIKNLTGREAQIHLDPALLGDFPEDLPSIPDSGYILVYSYDFRLSDPELIKETRAFAKKMGLKILSVGFYQSWVDKNVLPNPLELLSYFKNADYVITDTFHGTVFSARMHKQFLAVIRSTNKEKLGDLLSRLGLMDRQYSNGDSLTDLLNAEIDFDQFEHIRMTERYRSNEYLKGCLNR